VCVCGVFARVRLCVDVSVYENECLCFCMRVRVLALACVFVGGGWITIRLRYLLWSDLLANSL